jgi:hypothetical protein
MKRMLGSLIIVGLLLAAPHVALASCTMSTIFYNGRMVTCMTCCTGGYCTTNCY